jgi:TonB family protein
MSEKKQCVNCNRGIDVAAKSCLYCNWWQAEKPAARPQQAAPVETSAPAHPQSHMNRNVLGAIAFVALLIIAFVIGSLIHGFEPSEVKAAQQPKAPPAAVETQSPAPPTANIPLVPDNSAPPGPLDQTTTAPMTTTVSGAMGGDATAMTSEQYGAAQRALPPQQQAQTIDPRSVTGTVYGETQPMPPHVPRPHRATTMSRMTQPVPEYQPVPSLRGHGHARLTLTVGPDGRVRDVDIVQPLAGEMGRLVGAVQSWRFKPATDNGVPVTSRFTVDISVE